MARAKFVLICLCAITFISIYVESAEARILGRRRNYYYYNDGGSSNSGCRTSTATIGVVRVPVNNIMPMTFTVPMANISHIDYNFQGSQEFGAEQIRSTQPRLMTESQIQEILRRMEQRMPQAPTPQPQRSRESFPNDPPPLTDHPITYVPVEDPGRMGSPRDLDQRVVTILSKNNCAVCHSGSKPQGGLRIFTSRKTPGQHTVADLAVLTPAQKHNIWDMTDAGDMPQSLTGGNNQNVQLGDADVAILRQWWELSEIDREASSTIATNLSQR